MMYFNNLLLFMSACGSLAFVLYLIAKKLLGARFLPSYRYHLLQVVLALFILPLPLLGNHMKSAIRILLHNDTLFSYANPAVGEVVEVNLLKSITINDGTLILPHIDRVLLLLFSLWLLLFVCYLVYYFYHVHREKTLLTVDADTAPRACAALRPSYEALIRRRQVRILTSEFDSLSYTYGLLRPTIVLAPSLDEDERRCILMHELTHIRYCDSLYRGIAFLAVALHFFNPLSYLLFREVRLCMELHCDEVVTRPLSEEERIAYGMLLLKQSQQPRRTGYVTPFADRNYRMITERIRTIKTDVRRRRLSVFLSCLLLAAVSCAPALAYEVPHLYFDDPYANSSVTFEYIVAEPAPLPEEYVALIADYDLLLIDKQGVITPLASLVPSTDTCPHHYIRRKLLMRTFWESGHSEIEEYKSRYCTKCGKITGSKLLHVYIDPYEYSDN